MVAVNKGGFKHTSKILIATNTKNVTTVTLIIDIFGSRNITTAQNYAWLSYIIGRRLLISKVNHKSYQIWNPESST